MKISTLMLSIVIFLGGFTSHVVAAPDAALGAVLAKEWCVRCHNIEANGPFKLHPPSFASIAVFRSKEQIYGRIAFPPLHVSMPRVGYMLVPENIEDLVAYIVSLESK